MTCVAGLRQVDERLSRETMPAAGGGRSVRGRSRRGEMRCALHVGGPRIDAPRVQRDSGSTISAREEGESGWPAGRRERPARTAHLSPVVVLDHLLDCSYDKTMRIEFDPVKSEQNARLRSLSFDRVGDFDWETAIYRVDDRKDYPETRIIAVGFLGARLHVICFTPIDGGARIISLRKANRREVRCHEDETADR